jgi:pyruvate,orthophosphate dikinase
MPTDCHRLSRCQSGGQDRGDAMLGFRGCRLGIVYSEISEMQARAVFEAAAEVQKAGIKVKPEVMIPLVGFKKELDLQVAVVHAAAKAVMAEKKIKLSYMVGTMIEVPRGALTADEIAQTAEFFSFGTNDLTQTCLGMSRADKPFRKSSRHVDSLGSFRRWSRA